MTGMIMRAMLATAMIVLVSLQSSSGQESLSLVRTIDLPRVEGRIDHLAIDLAGQRLFVAALGNNTVEVVDLQTGRVITTWPVVSARSNFPMALDEANHRLFVGCRQPAKVLVYNTRNGTETASFDAVGDTDDLFYDAARQRLYVSGGEGFIDVFQEKGNRFGRVAHLPTAPGARTSLFVPEQNRLYLAVPHRGAQKA